MIGRRISHYEIVSLLGEGAMGQVYRARDLVLDRHVALKLVSGPTSTDGMFRERFVREARLAAQLNHPHIAAVYEFGEEAGEAFLVLELVEGETLADRLRRGPLPVADVRRLGAQVASALGAAHARGIVHRDIKPGNLMLTPEHGVKVMDFGIARRAGEATLTAAGNLVGTPKTMAPEILHGEEPGPAADLFSLGCVLYEALTGGAPFEAADAMAVLYRIANSDPASLREVRPDTPEDVSRVVEGLLVKDPTRRFGPAAAVAAALAGAPATWTGSLPAPASSEETLLLESGTAAAATGRAVPPATSPDLPSRARRRRPRLVYAGVAAILLLVVAGVVFVAGPGGSRARSSRERARALHAEGTRVVDRLHRAGGPALPDSIALARRYFEQAASVDRNDPAPWAAMGELSLLAGEPERAERELGRALELDPHDATARLSLATALEQRGRLDEAETAYRRAMSDDSTLVRAPIGLAQLLVQRGRPQEAAEVLRAATSRWPRDPALWRDLSLASMAAGDEGRAGEAVGRAMGLAPTDSSVLAAMIEFEAATRAAATSQMHGQWSASLDSALSRLRGLRGARGVLPPSSSKFGHPRTQPHPPQPPPLPPP